MPRFQRSSDGGSNRVDGGRFGAALLWAAALLGGAAIAQESPPGGGQPEGAENPGRPVPPGLREGREAMWPAPTAEDWKKPCLMTWQRTWEDAVAVAKETGRPILVCINMDGEIASEHYAGVRYRQPDIAALYEPYVCVIASVYRHNPRDYDDEGRRIPCPRFGGVTCGEHIDIEPVVFEKFCDGQRVAPRHICVELDGSESYDVYYRNDTASVFQDIRDGIAKRPPLPPNVVRSDRPILERAQSPDVRDRTAVEEAWRGGDRDRRRALLDAALQRPDARQLELLRLAIYGVDVEAAKKAREALARAEGPGAPDLISEALRVPMEASEREALVGALRRLSGTSLRARWLSVVHQGLSEQPGAIDLKRWSEARTAGGSAAAGAAREYERAALLEKIESATDASAARPADAAAHVELAEASLAIAVDAPRIFSSMPREARLFERQMHAEARRSALEAEKLGATGWRVNAVLALSAYYTGETEEAYRRAEAAVKELPPGDTTWTSMAVVTVFAEQRWKAIQKAARENQPWPPSWIADLHSAYSLLLRHPLGTDGQVVWHYDLLVWVGADGRADRVLREGLARFPGSAAIHERLRERILAGRGPEGLEAAYEKIASESGAEALPFAALASVTAAEQLRKFGRPEAAAASYGRAIGLYERALGNEPGDEALRRSLALALAGRARVRLQTGEDPGALEDLLASYERSPGAAGSRDGTGITPGETGQMLLAKLRAGGNEEAAARLEKALAALDQDLLRPDRE